VSEERAEPPDHHEYHWVSFNRDTFEFYLAAVKFYDSLLTADMEAIEQDADLKLILGERQRSTFEIDRETRRAQRVRTWMEGQISKGGADASDYDVNISHGWVRFIKSVCGLYLAHLRQRRNVLASRANVSKHALHAVDQRIGHFEEKTGLGVFRQASPWPLMVEDVVITDGQPDSPKRDLAESFSQVRAPKPVVIDTIEILDADLRKRCLDLLAAFKEDGQHDRLDTVVTDATRVLENRLRRLSGAAATCIGLELAKYCFGGSAPRLTVSEVAAEQEAAHLLFRGVFGFIRNQVHHRLVENLQPERVLQVVAMIDYLLFVADGAVRKEAS